MITEGETYDIKFNVYVPADSGHFNVYYCVFDTTTTSIGNFSNGYGTDMVLECKVTFTAKDGDRVFALYCAGVMSLGDENTVSKFYMGDFTIKAHGGPCKEIDCNWTDGETKVSGVNPHEVVDRPDIETLKAADSGFSDKVLYAEWTAAGDALLFDDSADFITAGKTYIVTFRLYVPADSGHFNIYYFLPNTTSTGLSNFSNGYNTDVILDCNVVFTAKEGDYLFGLYCGGVMSLGEENTVPKFYMGDITIKEVTE